MSCLVSGGQRFTKRQENSTGVAPADQFFSIHTIGTGEVSCALVFGNSEVVSPDSVSTSNKDEGASPATINRVDELISILAFNEKG
jgi:hypothetical protein